MKTVRTQATEFCIILLTILLIILAVFLLGDWQGQLRTENKYADDLRELESRRIVSERMEYVGRDDWCRLVLDNKFGPEIVDEEDST